MNKEELIKWVMEDKLVSSTRDVIEDNAIATERAISLTFEKMNKYLESEIMGLSLINSELRSQLALKERKLEKARNILEALQEDIKGVLE